MPSKKHYIKQMNKCNIAFLIGYIPFFIYGIFSPFSQSYLILLYTFYVFLNFFYFLFATNIEEIFILLYFLIASIVGALLFFSVIKFIYLILILLLGASLIAFILYKEVKQKYFRNTLIATQTLFFLLLGFTLLNLNILHIESDELNILHPLFIFHITPFFLFSGYGLFNLGKMLDDHKLIQTGARSIIVLLYLSLGITILFIYCKLTILAAICFALGLTATIFLYSYANKELNKAKRKSRRKKK